MKFACEQCKTQYLISDEKIGPRGVRVRCKRCSNVIVLLPDGSISSLKEQKQVTESNKESSDRNPEQNDGDKDELGRVFENLFKSGENDEDNSDWDINGSDVTQLFDPEDLKKLHSKVDFDEDSQKIDRAFADAESTNIGPQELNRQKQFNRDWYIVAEGQQQGPLTLQELESMMSEGRINTGDYVWRPGLLDWVAMQEVAELRHLFSKQTGEADSRIEGVFTEKLIDQERLQGGWSASSEESSLSDLVQKELESVKESKKDELDQDSVSHDSFDSSSFQSEGPWIDDEGKGRKSGFFDSTIEQTTSYTIDDDGVKIDGFLDRQLARPAYLSESGRHRVFKRCLIFGSAFVLLLLASVAVYRFVFGGELPFSLFDDQKVISPMTAAFTGQKDGPDPKAIGEIDHGSKNQTEGDKAGQSKITESTKSDKESQKVQKSLKRNGLIATAEAKTIKTPKKLDQPVDNKNNISKGKKRAESSKKSHTAELKKDKLTKRLRKEKPKSRDRRNKGSLNKGQIYEVMKKSIPAMKGCVKQQLQRDPSVKGTLLVSFVINPSGRVASVTILSKEHVDTYVSDCIGYIIKEMRFPQFDGDPITVPKVPLTLGH